MPLWTLFKLARQFCEYDMIALEDHASAGPGRKGPDGSRDNSMHGKGAPNIMSRADEAYSRDLG